jgi:hypothetical protein
LSPWWKFIQWLSRYTPDELQTRRQRGRQQAMAQRPPSAPQWAYLAALGDSGPAPATTAEAFAAIPRFPQETHPRYVPPERDFWKVVDVAKEQDRVLLLTFVFTAARRSEVYRLQ